MTLVFAGISAIYGLVFFMVEAKQKDLEHRLDYVTAEINKGDRFTKNDGDKLNNYLDKHGSAITSLRTAVAAVATMTAECRVNTESLIYRIRRLENNHYDKKDFDDTRNSSVSLFTLQYPSIGRDMSPSSTRAFDISCSCDIREREPIMDTTDFKRRWLTSH